MSFFSVALEAAMAADGLTQAELSRRSGAPQGQISKYLAGDLLPDGSTLEKLCAALPAEAARLTGAFARDQVPRALRPGVEIREAEQSLRMAEDPPLLDILRRLPPRVQKMLEAAARECEQRPEFITALDSLLAITRKRPAE